MKYKITIEKIEVKNVVKETYYPKEKNKAGGEGAYADTAVDEEVSTEIYSQISDGEIHLKNVIDAFNSEVK